MFHVIKSNLTNFFSKGHERTLLAKKNIAISFILKGLSICISLFLVPLTINFVNATQYGIWLTLSSVINWFSFFDVGLGNGLKNKLAETNALKQYDDSKIYVSTTYAILILISAILILVFLIINIFVDWSKILNTPNVKGESLNLIALIVFVCFCIQFVLQIINTILIANHAIARVSLISLIGQFISMVIVYILSKTTSGSLTEIVVIFSVIPILTTLLATIFYFNGDYKLIAPSFKSVDFKHGKGLLTTGGMFFFVQLGGLILFQTDNIIVVQLFGPKEVTSFNLSYKLFSIVSMAFAIIMAPFWSSFTDAYSKRDMDWIQNIFYKMYKYFSWLIVLTFILLISSPYLIELWIGKNIKVPFFLSLNMAFYTIGFCWLLIHCSLLNGINKIRIQLYLYIISSIINIPLAIILGKSYGVAGVTFSNVLVLTMMGIVLYIQCKKILNNTAFSFWNQ